MGRLIIPTFSLMLLFQIKTLAQNIISHYTFEENTCATAIDAIGKNPGMVLGNPIVQQAGRFEKCWLFYNNDAGLDLGCDPSIRPLDSIAIALWFKPLAMSYGQRLIEGQAYRLYFGPSANLIWQVNSSAGTVTIESSLELEINKWYFAAVIFEKALTHNIVQITVGNANSVKTDMCSSAIAPLVYNSKNVFLGQNGNNSAEIFAYIDDVSFWDYPLSNAELDLIRLMGAQTLYQEHNCPRFCGGNLDYDLNHDCIINFSDFADMTSHQDINFIDLCLFAETWLFCNDVGDPLCDN